MSEEETLLDGITRCPEVGTALGDPAHPCSAVVGVQTQAATADRQVPEPWNGHIAFAPILFVSSNPSISFSEEYPTGSWDEARRRDFFDGRFDEERDRPWIEGGARTRQKAGDLSGPVRFLSFVRRRASELLGSEARPGIDYCLTEVVHCKSRREIGVRSAVGRCADLWLDRVLRVSGARVIVVLGDIAAAAVGEHADLNLARERRTVGPVELGGRARDLVFMPHPNARMRRTFAILDPGDLSRLRDAIRSIEGR